MASKNQKWASVAQEATKLSKYASYFKIATACLGVVSLGVETFTIIKTLRDKTCAE
jgi:hypothetical protein